MTNEDLIKIGFKETPHFTITNSVNYDLGRFRVMTAGSVGTPNECLWLCEIDDAIETKISDLVCIHNYDYDGVLTIDKVESLIKAIKGC